MLEKYKEDMTTMSFIKKIKKKGKTYAIEVEGYRDKDGKVKHKYLRYLGTVDENGKVKSSQKSITVDKVLRFGLPAIVSRSIEQLKLRRPHCSSILKEPSQADLLNTRSSGH